MADSHDDIYRRYEPQDPTGDKTLLRLAELDVEQRRAESRLDQAKAADDKTAVKLFKADVRAARQAYREAAAAAGMRALVRTIDNESEA
jgi:RecA/RadA recombinase